MVWDVLIKEWANWCGNQHMGHIHGVFFHQNFNHGLYNITIKATIYRSRSGGAHDMICRVLSPLCHSTYYITTIQMCMQPCITCISFKLFLLDPTSQLFKCVRWNVLHVYAAKQLVWAESHLIQSVSDWSDLSMARIQWFLYIHMRVSIGRGSQFLFNVNFLAIFISTAVFKTNPCSLFIIRTFLSMEIFDVWGILRERKENELTKYQRRRLLLLILLLKAAGLLCKQCYMYNNDLFLYNDTNLFMITKQHYRWYTEWIV